MILEKNKLWFIHAVFLEQAFPAYHTLKKKKQLNLIEVGIPSCHACPSALAKSNL